MSAWNEIWPRLGKLAGQLAVIIGGTAGIGLAVAKLFVREGAYVFITVRRQKEQGREGSRQQCHRRSRRTLPD